MSFAAVVLVVSASMSHAALPADYQERPAAEKCDILLSNVQGDSYSSLPFAPNGALDMLKLFDPNYLIQTFTVAGDEMPRGRKKLIHTYGATLALEMRMAENSPYTGLFAAGAVSRGLARLSVAATDLTQFTPGMALKFPVSGQESVNFVIMPSLDGQGTDLNPFRKAYTSILPDPTRLNFITKFLLKAFRNTTAMLQARFGGPESENKLPVSAAARVNADGSAVAEPVAPYELVYVPYAEITENADRWIAAHPGSDFREGLAAVTQDGTVLGRIMLRDSAGGELKNMGELVARSSFHAGPYQDRVLYFPHQHKLR